MNADGISQAINTQLFDISAANSWLNVYIFVIVMVVVVGGCVEIIGYFMCGDNVFLGFIEYS